MQERDSDGGQPKIRTKAPLQIVRISETDCEEHIVSSKALCRH